MSIRNISIIFLFIFNLSTSVIHSQTYNRELNPFQVSDSQGNLKNTFSGGFNNLEPQFVDIDNDGDLDLFYLNSDGSFGWLKNTGSVQNADFTFYFDTIPGLEINDWFYFVDIDNDNDLDLFTASKENTIEFLRNTGTPSNPYFVLEEDTLRTSNGNPIYSESGSNPCFVDIDADGDNDFITGNSIGTLTFYENIGNSQNFNFEFVTNSWQDILIISGGSPINLHGASSLDFKDIDNDGDLDIFWGDFFSRSLYFISNNGNAQNPDMEVLYNRYPQNMDSVWTSGFNMPRLVDIDNDNDLDMFVSVLYDPTVPQSLMFYRNNGTSSSPDLRKITENYLHTLDVGNTSIPVFVDIDNDGDPDLFMGSENNPDGTLYFFKNIGSSNNPNFTLADSLYFNIHNELSIAPAFGDLDGDNDYDLLIGNFDGTISFYQNIGNANQANFIFQNELKTGGDTTIDAGIYARPFLIDIDNDNDLDLVLGGFNGKIFLFRNLGTQSSPLFEPDLNYFGNIDIGDNSAPFLIDFDKDGDLDLFSGSQDGNIFYFRNDGNNVSPTWDLITNKFIGQGFGPISAPFFVDIDSDSDLDLFVGNVKGGLYFYRNSEISSVKENRVQMINSFSLNAYPNPFNPSTTIEVINTHWEDFTITIYNILGQKIKVLFKGNLTAGSHKFLWDGKNELGSKAASGNYIVTLKNKENIKSIKISLLK